METTPASKFVALFFALTTITGCAEHELVTAPAPRTVAAPSRIMTALPSFLGSLPTAGGSTLALPSYAAYPEGILIAMTVSGTIHVTSDSHANYFHSDADVGPGGVWIGGVYQQCSIGVVLTFGGTNFRPPSCSPYDASTLWTQTAVVQGSGTAKRNPNIPWYSPGSCDTIVCHTYSGSQTVAIDPVAGELDLQARYALEARTVRTALFIHPFTNSEPYAYQRVTFTDSTTPRGLPMKSLSHTWTMSDPDYPGGSWGHTYVPCGASPVCPVDIRETGVWTSQVRVNGVEHTDAIAVYCADTEPLLNNDVLRQQLLAALDSANAWSNSPLQIHERAFFVLQDVRTPGSPPYLLILPQDPNADECSANGPMPMPATAPENTKIVAWGHTHPFEDQDWGYCKDPAGVKRFMPFGRGASEDDRKSADSVNSASANPTAQAAGWLPMSSYIIDKNNIYILRPGQKLGDELAPGNVVNWDGLSPTDPNNTKGRCKWPKRGVL